MFLGKNQLQIASDISSVENHWRLILNKFEHLSPPALTPSCTTFNCSHTLDSGSALTAMLIV